MESSSEVLSTKNQSVLELVINRPERKNALNLAMYTELAAQLQEAGKDSTVRVVLITGAGGCFTSGNDLEDFARGADMDLETSPITRFMTTLLDFPKPVVVAVDGLAIGIGTTLLLHCDVVVVADQRESARQRVHDLARNRGCRIVAAGPSRPIAPVWVNAAAGLIAGTVPTIGTCSTSRTMPRAMVLAVLQAIVINRGANRSDSRPSNPATRAAISASVFSP